MKAMCASAPTRRAPAPHQDRPAHKDAEIGRIITVDRGRYTAILDEGKSSERVVTAVRARELRRSPSWWATRLPSWEIPAASPIL